MFCPSVRPGRAGELSGGEYCEVEQDKCGVLHLGKNKCLRLGAALMEKRSVEKDLGVQVENRLAASQQCALATKMTNSILG